MNDTLIINPELSIYIITDVGFVVTSFEEDIFIDNAVASAVLLGVHRLAPNIDELMQALQEKYAPPTLAKIIQSMMLNKYIQFSNEFETRGDESKATDASEINICLKALYSDQFNESDFNISFSYFESIVLGTNNKAKINATLSESTLLIGPIDRQGEGVCQRCFKGRLLSHRPILKFVEAQGASVEYVPSYIKINTSLKGFQLKCNETLDANLFWEINLATGEAKSYSVIPFGGCELCRANTQNVPTMAQVVEGLRKQRTHGFRVVSAEDTLKKTMPLVHSSVGIIAKLEPYKKTQKTDNPLVCNYTSGRNLAMVSSNRFWLNNHIRSASGGKGSTQLQAKVSALCEAVERYSMIHQGQAAVMNAAYADISEKAVDPKTCLNYSELQFNNRDEINKKTTAFHQLIPRAFDPQAAVDWSEAYSLTQNKPCYVLSEMAYAQYKGRDETEIYAFPDSNGCASGSSYLDAILQGTLELIERDAVALWWYNMCERNCINIASIGNDYISSVYDYYLSLDRALHIIDITSDLGVPCFVAVSYHLQTKNQILYGFGCHVDPCIAIERCVTELNQLLPLAISKRSTSCDQSLFKWMDLECIDNHPYLNADENKEIDFSVYLESAHCEYLQDAVDFLVQRLDEQDIELIAFDLMQKDTGLPVVKMMAPGLRHFWRRTGAGRLYDVPVRMGWLDKVLTEDQLNEKSITI